MKNILVLLSFCLVLTSCLDKDAEDFETIKKNDESAIEAINEEQSLGLTKSNSGIYYVIEDANPTGREIDTKVEVFTIYSLKKFNGTEILASTLEDSTIFNFYRNDAFSGFLLALDEMREGEKALFYIPSYLAYQDQPISGLSPWEPIILELEVPIIYSEKEQIALYYERNAIEPDTLYENGISAQYIDVNIEGAKASDNPIVNVNYVGTYLDGTAFDDGTFEIDLTGSSVIEGFKESALTMNVGEKAVFLFPSELGYGETGFGNTIPPFAPLRFEIELVSAR